MLINQGRYKARAVEAVLGLSGTGSEQVAVAFELLDGAHAGQLVTWYGFFTERTRESTLLALRVCGGSLADLSGVVRNEVEVVIEHETDLKGALKARVRWVNRLGGTVRIKRRMSSEEASRFAATLAKGVVVTAPDDATLALSEDDADEPF